MRTYLSSPVRRAIERHAIGEYPRECCGLIIMAAGRSRYVPCRNMAANDQDFQIAPEDYAAAEDTGDVIAVVHSHINQCGDPSQADRVACEASGLVWHIVGIEHDPMKPAPGVIDWHMIVPKGYQAPLVGRTFHHGTLDCYGLVRDFYARELGIELPDFEREDDWWTDPEAEELYLENFGKAGFVQAHDGPRYADVILMQYRSDKTNHAGIYLGDQPLKTQPDLHPVPQAMLHHAMPRLSERVMYAGYWADITRMIVRHKSMT